MVRPSAATAASAQVTLCGPRRPLGLGAHPPMHQFLRRSWLALVFTPLIACSSGSDGGSSATSGSAGMSIVSCTLGCTGSGSGGLSCSVTSIFVNQDIWLEFSLPVDPASVNKSSFQVVNASTGQAPAGFYQVDSQNPRRVAFRPQLSFDSTGNPTFGLTAGQSYRVTVPVAGGTTSVIRAVGGQPNTSPVQCFVQATLGVNDPVPGPPLVEVFVELVATGPASAVPAQGAEDVALLSRLRLEFADIMNPATLVNPATSESNFVTVNIDVDGDLNTSADQVPLSGAFTIAIDDVARRTTVTFTPNGGFPSAGSDLDNPRRVVLDLPPTILDLGGNSLANAGKTTFTTAVVLFPPTLLPYGTGEDFSTSGLVDFTRTSAALNVSEPTPGVPVGRVLPGFGGGSGRFGDLVIKSGQTLVIDTGAVGSSFGPTVVTDLAAGDVRTFVIDNYDPDLGELPGSETLTAENGVFEFSSLIMEPGSILRASGAHPPRLMVRGEARLGGLVVLSGNAPGNGAVHLGPSGIGQTGGLGAQAAGNGGKGGDRQNTNGTALQNIGGFSHGVGVVVSMNGATGQGRAGAASAGGGGGGVTWPSPTPGPALTDVGGFKPNLLCFSMQVGAPGAGGSFGSIGNAGTWAPPFPTFNTPPAPPPPLATGGPDLLRASETTLDPEAGLLIGGAGGGGGGTGIAGSRTNGLFTLQCNVPVGQSQVLQVYRDASGAGGGGGGGTMQIQAGRRLLVEGTIDVTGGPGGRAPIPGQVDGNDVDQNAMPTPGGGGSGGSVLLQSLEVVLASFAGVVDLRGGLGGENPGGISQNNPSRGGSGGAGIVRIEKSPLLSLTLATEAAKLLPATGGTNQPAPGDLLAIANWSPVTVGFGARSALQSCWLIPSGSPFQVDFLEDDNSDPLNPVLGWNMDVEFVGGLIAPYRGPSLVQALLGQDVETLLGTTLRQSAPEDLSAAPILVRFQGARVVAPLELPCESDPFDPASPFLIGSLTPWVLHPAELNDYWNQVYPGDNGLAAVLKPNAIRYQIVFDRQAGDPLFRNALQAVRSLFVRVQPD